MSRESCATCASRTSNCAFMAEECPDFRPMARMYVIHTEQNTPKIASQIHAAAWKKGWRKFTLHYEHGQWWLSHRNGAQYSVVDAEGGPAINGFDFEQVTRSDDER